MSTATTTTSTDTGQHTPTRGRQCEAQQPVTQEERNAAQRLRTTMAAGVLDVQAVQAAQNVVPVAVTAGDKIERLRQWASGRCLSADRVGVYSQGEQAGGRCEGACGSRV